MLGLETLEHFDMVDLAYPLHLLLGRKAQSAAEGRAVFSIIGLRYQVQIGRNKETGERAFSKKQPWAEIKDGGEQWISSKVEQQLTYWYTLWRNAT